MRKPQHDIALVLRAFHGEIIKRHQCRLEYAVRATFPSSSVTQCANARESAQRSSTKMPGCVPGTSCEISFAFPTQLSCVCLFQPGNTGRSALLWQPCTVPWFDRRRLRCLASLRFDREDNTSPQAQQALSWREGITKIKQMRFSLCRS